MKTETTMRITSVVAVAPMAAAATIAGSASYATTITDYSNDDLTADGSNIVLFDLDGDGLADFQFYIKDQSGVLTVSDRSFKSDTGISGILVDDSETNFAREFSAGDSVERSGPYNYVFSFLYSGSEGPLGDGVGDTAFVGLGVDGHNGWAEFERGSLTLLRTGFQSTSGAAAVIPATTAVPLPGSIGLLATGAAGLAAMRRRKKAA